MDVLGLVRIRVRRGINLAVRDTVSSDPYCVITCATQGKLLYADGDFQTFLSSLSLRFDSSFNSLSILALLVLDFFDPTPVHPGYLPGDKHQKVKTKVVRGTCNPVWNEELTIYIKDLDVPIVLCVFDKDTFTVDDSMGRAKIDIKPLIECLRMGLEGLPDGTKVDRVQPSKDNCLADESCIIWNKGGKMTQDMLLRLEDVECGQIEIQIEWIQLPGNKGL